MQSGLDYGSVEVDLAKGILPDSYFWEFHPSRARFVFDRKSGALAMSRLNEYAVILPLLTPVDQASTGSCLSSLQV